MKTFVIVQNLKCEGCAKTITNKLSELENISNVFVDLDSATVSFEPQNVDAALSVKDRLKSLGYPSIDDKNSVKAKAVSFFSCASGKMSK